MALEDRIIEELKARDGSARRNDIASLHHNPVIFARVLRKLVVEGKIQIDVLVRLTASGLAHGERDFNRRQPRMHRQDMLAPPEHVFKELSDEDLNRIREEALLARELVG